MWCRGPATTSSRRSRPTARRSSTARRRRSDARAVLRQRRRRLRRADCAGGEPMLVRDGGNDPRVRSHRHAHLSPRSPQREVHAVQRRRADGRDSRCRDATRSSTCAATTRPSIAPSPDGKWLAFEERFQHLRRAVPAHRPSGRHRSGDAGRIPVQRVSRDAGFYLHWSGDSRRSLGARARSSSRATSTTRSRSSTGGQRRKARRARGQGRATSASPRRATSRPATVALVGARMITMAGLSRARSPARLA